MNHIVTILPGSKLTQTDLETINFLRKKVFNSKEPIAPNSSSQYFIAKDLSGNILSFAILRPTSIEFRQKTYSIFEFVSLVAAEKGKGYGSFLLNNLITYSKSKGKTLLGFCLSELAPFYLKNNLEIFPTGPDRFSFKVDQWSFPGETPGFAIFAPGDDSLIEEMKKFKEEVALITRHKKN